MSESKKRSKKIDEQYEPLSKKTFAMKFWEQIKSLFWALLAALVIRQFVVANYTIPTPSMEDDLLVGDFLFVNKFVYGMRTPDWLGIPFTEIGFDMPFSLRLPALDYPEQGDIIVFKYPRNPKLDYVKRVIATGGQTVKIVNKKVYVDDVLFPDPPHSRFVDGAPEYRCEFNPSLGTKDNFGPVKVPEGHFFVMGDNRDNSSDSRFWGFVPWENVVGRPLLIVFSQNKHIPLYHFFSKVRWDRIATIIR